MDEPCAWADANGSFVSEGELPLRERAADGPAMRRGGGAAADLDRGGADGMHKEGMDRHDEHDDGDIGDDEQEDEDQEEDEDEEDEGQDEDEEDEGDLDEDEDEEEEAWLETAGAGGGRSTARVFVDGRRARAPGSSRPLD
ncbi:hypothetical protein FNF27_06128 [Cafeteria roenbergensis]|uniref:Uncharacterized protein n=1 Tax=Cafeteria roenbergensis TaxID=33653 RepID=A0A5A8E2V3_CAFRO|nr:hypothetical protein FNF27_06128 [Cafeteria roenbergensis]